MIATIDPTVSGPRLPCHPDGGQWVYSVLDGSGTITLSDSATDLVGLTIPGYDALAETDEGHDEALGMRYEFIIELARRTQESLVNQLVASAALDLSTLGEDTLTALFADRVLPFEGVTGPDGQISFEWTEVVPLVLIATDYAPYTECEMPTGRIIRLDPSTEVTFLRSLHELGIIELGFLAGADPDLSPKEAGAQNRNILRNLIEGSGDNLFPSGKGSLSRARGLRTSAAAFLADRRYHPSAAELVEFHNAAAARRRAGSERIKFHNESATWRRLLAADPPAIWPGV